MHCPTLARMPGLFSDGTRAGIGETSTSTIAAKTIGVSERDAGFSLRTFFRPGRKSGSSRKLTGRPLVCYFRKSTESWRMLAVFPIRSGHIHGRFTICLPRLTNGIARLSRTFACLDHLLHLQRVSTLIHVGNAACFVQLAGGSKFVEILQTGRL